MKFKKVLCYSVVVIVAVIILYTVRNAYVASQTITNAGQ